VSARPLDDALNAVVAIADLAQPRSPSVITTASTTTSAGTAAGAATNAVDAATAANLQLADSALQLSLSAAHPLDVSAALAALSLTESQAAATAAAATTAAAAAAAASTASTSDGEQASDTSAAATAAAALAAEWAQYVEALAERHKPRRAALQKALLSHCGADLQALAHTLSLQQQQQAAQLDIPSSTSSSRRGSADSSSSSEQDAAAAVEAAEAAAAAAAQQRVLAWAVEKRGGWRGAVLLDSGEVDVEADVTIWPQRDQASSSTFDR
jgi:hypothetical protein